MPRQLWLADKLREWGCNVVEVDGWQYRGSEAFHPQGVIAHHTAGPATGDYPSLRIVRDGRAGLSGPLSQLGLGRTGTVYVIAAGRANHAGTGSWRGLSGNYSVFGIEAESTGTRNDWTAEQRKVYPIVCAALLDGIGRDERWLCGHKEWTTRKIDPAFWDMDDMRRQVAALLAAGPGKDWIEMASIEEVEAMFRRVLAEGDYLVAHGERQWVIRETAGLAVHIKTKDDFDRLRKAFPHRGTVESLAGYELIV